MSPHHDWPFTYSEPNWASLESVLSPKECEEYMYMGVAGTVVLYKHRWTRRYLNVSLDGQTFYRYTGAGYVEIERMEALEDARR